MKRICQFFCLSLGGLLMLPSAKVFAQMSDYPIRPVDFTEVSLTEGFWRDRLNTVSDVTIPYAFQKCEETGRINNFIYAGGLKEGKFEGDFGFDDSDVYKIMEGAAYSLMLKENPELEAYLDTLVSYLEAAQEDDGYLYTSWTLKANEYNDFICCSYDPSGRFEGSRLSHELYNAGHMYEAAVAHYRATGKDDFLNIAIRNADLIYQLCVEEGKDYYPGHQEIEIGLVKLYRVTENEKYLELAKLFLDRRGKGLRTYENEENHLATHALYSQDHQPVTEQREAVGHSVRAAYMYSSMADIAAIMGDQAYLEASDKLWENIVSKKMYVTGGLGAGNGIEGFDVEYALPNDAYAETCAAIANVYWNHRMFLLHGDSKYIDVLERTLYNGLIAGLSMEGETFFYPNPLEFNGESTFNQGAVCRSEWFDCSCCPSNLSRFVPSVGGYVYAVDNQEVYVNLFMNNRTEVDVNDQKLALEQVTQYPWEGDVSIRVNNEQPVQANLMIRIPGWSANEAVPSDLYTYKDKSQKATTIKVNGKAYKFSQQKGYAVVEGNWKKGDRIDIQFSMEIKTVLSHEKIKANTGKVAVERGPLVYCAEGVDNDGHAMDLHLDSQSPMKANYKKDLLNGVTVLQGRGWVESPNKKMNVQLIPYYAWSHRDISPMSVWLLHDE
ncbi:glycoside hydrolase family 127 protein [Catalinimonas niigatensis]|uniref:glycoside hydrolase family 127 protein n=1 Tax=Catalinimonas niigatensis TaxID=1397264 RepID=UPI0026661BA2|nr:beta-L-arabinofuranosidase domain-containing protein [Catalinimonas niigatensis]WPP51667.1 glycoside hydrolase family 127 protein [Catalinimonas niigatensis]